MKRVAYFIIIFIVINTVKVKAQTTTDSLQLRSSGNFLKLYAAPTSTNYGIVFPANIPSANQFLRVSSVAGTKATTSWVDSSTFNNTYWALLGNSNTNATALNSLGTNFLGTTDVHSLVFRTNNILAGYIGSTTTDNLSLGISAGNATTATTGANTFIGNQSGNSNVSGIGNTYVGYQSGYTATGSNNTALGYQSGGNGASNSGGSNTSIGYQSGQALNASANNTFVGYQAGTKITSSGYGGNTFVGYNAGSSYATIQYGTFIGNGADAGGGTLTNVGAIGYNAKVTTSNSIVLGATGANAVNVGIGVTAPSARLEIDTTGSSTAALKIKSPFTGSAATDSLLTWNSSDNIVYKVRTDSLLSKVGVPISSLLPATKTNTIENTNYEQIWNWSNIKNIGDTALILTANNLGAGSLLTLSSTSSALTTGTLLNVSGVASSSTTNGLLSVANTTGTSTGLVFHVQPNNTGTSNVGSTGAGFNVNANGQIGINTTTPTLGYYVDLLNKNDVNGQYGVMYMRSQATQGINIDIKNGAATGIASIGTYANDIRLQTYNGSTTQPVITISGAPIAGKTYSTAGYVGIGTAFAAPTSITAPLSVANGKSSTIPLLKLDTLLSSNGNLSDSVMVWRTSDSSVRKVNINVNQLIVRASSEFEGYITSDLTLTYNATTPTEIIIPTAGKLNDVGSEYNSTTGFFTPKATGVYVYEMQVTYNTVSYTNANYGSSTNNRAVMGFANASNNQWVGRFNIEATIDPRAYFCKGVVSLTAGLSYYFGIVSPVSGTLTANPTGTTGSGIGTYFSIQRLK